MISQAWTFKRRSPLLALLCLFSISHCRRQIIDEKATTALVFPPLPIQGRVIDTDGHPIAEARVLTAEGAVTTQADGSFTTPAGRGNRWVTAEHAGFVSRTRAASPQTPLLLRLTPDPEGDVVSLLFAGDTMFGRRFYDTNGDGNTDDALIHSDQLLASQKALLAGVKPLLANADLSFVNLETPLTYDNPYYPPNAERPEAFHASKQFAFASHASAAEVLRDAGVDILGLSNNHLYDLKDRGLSQTLQILNESGYHSGLNLFGAGRSLDEAWLQAFSSPPLINRAVGAKIAFIGCTTITGEEQAMSYVASIDKGGAAACDLERIKTQITAARATSEAVVFMVHGGFEYERQPTPRVREFTQAAVDAGATLVINHHPHVVGGLRWNPTPASDPTRPASLVAWSMGNLLFDQNIWQTFESYVLIVQMRHGKIIQAYTEPLLLERYLPHGVTGDLASFVAKGAAGREPNMPFVIENGSAVLDLSQRARTFEQRQELREVSDGAGTIVPVTHGSVVGFEPTAAGSSIRLGRDLLWTGSFEDDVVGLQPQAGALWLFPGFDKEISPAHAFRGAQGAGLWRERSDDRDVVLTPQHRILIKPGTQVSLTGMARSRDPFTIQISWYPDAKGPSTLKTLVVQPIANDEEWHPFRIDATVPELPAPLKPPEEPIYESERIKPSIGIFMRLPPSDQGKRTAVDFDDLRLIEWAPADAGFSPLYDFVRIQGQGTLILREKVLPGAGDWAAPWSRKE